MKLKIELLSDAIFGSGKSVPGGEDIAVLHDEYGFPYIAGSNIKGVLREEIENYLSWCQDENIDGDKQTDIDEKPEILFGVSPDKEDVNCLREEEEEINFHISDFKLPIGVRQAVLKEMNVYDEKSKVMNLEKIQDIFTSIRTFTKITDGVSADGSLRNARCVRKGLIFEGEIICKQEDETFIKECLKYVKCLGTMRTRGFGNVRISEIEGSR